MGINFHKQQFAEDIDFFVDSKPIYHLFIQIDRDNVIIDREIIIWNSCSHKTAGWFINIFNQTVNKTMAYSELSLTLIKQIICSLVDYH